MAYSTTYITTQGAILAAKTLRELVEWSGGLYKLPEKYNK